MLALKTAIVILGLFLVGTASPLAAESLGGMASYQILATDPVAGSTVSTGDKLYLRLNYESRVPVRFLPEAMRQGLRQEDAVTSSTPPYAAGRGEALVWISFSRPVRIDEIRVTAFDMEWQELATLPAELIVTWEDQPAAEERVLATWVSPLGKQHRQVFDQAYDPLPEKPETLFDVFFLLSIMAIPIYLALQVRMLIRYRDGWRKYALAPLLPVLPLCLYSLFGLGLHTEHWIIFLFRYFPAALGYLLIVWIVKWFYDKRQRPGSSLS